MKQVAILITFLTLSFFASAQQTAPVATAKKATPVMKVDSKPSVITIPAANNTAPKACCAGKTQAQCSHDSKGCTKPEESKPVCCQKSGSTCTGTAAKKKEEKKAE